MHALWGLPRQSGRWRHSACVPSVGRMHPRKCVTRVVSCRMQREYVKRVGWAVGVVSGHPDASLSLIYILLTCK